MDLQFGIRSGLQDGRLHDWQVQAGTLAEAKRLVSRECLARFGQTPARLQELSLSGRPVAG